MTDDTPSLFSDLAKGGDKSHDIPSDNNMAVLSAADLASPAAQCHLYLYRLQLRILPPAEYFWTRHSKS